MSLDIRRMRHVLSLADHGSFARAATALRLSQPALSRSIQSVENEAGTRLFVRTTSGVELTDSGHVLVGRMRQIVGLSDALDHEVVSDRTLQSGHVHAGSGGGSTHALLTGAVSRFMSTYPRLTVHMIIREWEELLRPLRAREIEFFVAETSTFDRETDLDIEPLQSHQLFIIGRRGHPLEARAPVAFDDGLAFPYLSMTRTPPRAMEPMRAARHRLAGAGPPRRSFPALQMNSIDMVKRLVAGSDALMVSPLSCVDVELEQGTLVALGSEPYLVSGYGIVKLRSQPLTAAAARFRLCILEAERSLAAREQKLVERHGPRPSPEDPPAGHARTGGPPRRPPRSRT